MYEGARTEQRKAGRRVCEGVKTEQREAGRRVCEGMPLTMMPSRKDRTERDSGEDSEDVYGQLEPEAGRRGEESMQLTTFLHKCFVQEVTAVAAHF